MTKLKHYILVVLATILLAVPNVWGRVEFKVVPRQNVVSGQNFQLTYRITVENEDINDISMFKAPEIAGCRLLSGPNQTTSQMSQTIINGKSSTYAVIDLVCVYRAGNPGKVHVAPVSINIGGRTYRSGEISFDILPPDKNASAPGAMGSPAVQGAPSGNDFFVRVIFSKSSVYEQEGVIAITKLYRPNSRKFSLQLEAVPKTPVYEGFLSEDLKANPEGEIENYNGKNYVTYELSRVLLFPQKAGTLKVTSGTYTLRIQEQVGVISMHGFATPRYDEYSYTTPLATGTINVTALPEPRPANFIGAVGQYSMSTTLTPDMLRTNESAAYRVSIKGTGNVKYLTIPQVQFPATFDTFTPKTDVKASVAGQTYNGVYTVDYPIVPQEVGTFEIPAQSFTYFNLATHKYETLDAPAYNCNVAKGTAASTAVEQKKVDAQMDDILYIHTGYDTDGGNVSSPVFYKAWYWILWAIVLASLGISVAAYRRHNKLAADVTGRAYARANRVAAKRLKTAASFIKAHDSDKFYEELARTIKGYLSDKLGMAPSQLISDTISERLTALGVSADTVSEILSVLDDCEMARFTPSQSENAMNDVYKRAADAIKTIEETKK